MHFKAVSKVKGCGLALGLIAGSSVAAGTNRPFNLLFIITDQQRFDALSCAGNPVVRTPNLDRLAKGGVRFENACTYCPVCAPARSVILTGVSPRSTGVYRNSDAGKKEMPDLTTFDEVLLRNGYQGEYRGKWHSPYLWSRAYTRPVVWKNKSKDFSDVSETDAFSQYVKNHVPARDLKPGEKILRRYQRPYLPDSLESALSSGKKSYDDDDDGKANSAYGCLDVPPEYTLTAFTAKEGLESLERLKDKPFTLTVSIVAPHPPMVAAKPYYGMYPPEAIPLPVSLKDLRENSPYPGSDKDSPYHVAEYVRQKASDYYGLVTEDDDWIGRILTRLDELKLSDHTLVVFTSDHGEMLGEHGMSGKGVFYDGAVRIPLIMRLPGVIPSGTVVDNPVSHIDLFSTILDYLHMPATESQGRSLRPLVEGKSDGIDYCVSEWRSGDGPTFMVRTREWKYMCSDTLHADCVDALYNLKEDPAELHNLIGHNPSASRYKEQVQAMRDRLVNWLEHIHDPRAESIRARTI